MHEIFIIGILILFLVILVQKNRTDYFWGGRGRGYGRRWRNRGFYGYPWSYPNYFPIVLNDHPCETAFVNSYKNCIDDGRNKEICDYESKNLYKMCKSQI